MAGSSQDLSFTASTWNTNQAITVTAAEDSDRVDESATLTYSIVTADTVPDYDGVSNVTRTVSVTDNDRTILTSAVTGTITEAGGSATFTVKLGDKPPTADVTIAVSSGDPGEGTVSPSTSARLRTTESGGTAAFTVKLSSEPTGDVVLGVASSDTAEGTVSTSSLTFTATTWSTAQTVTLTGVDDSPTPSNPNPSAPEKRAAIFVGPEFGAVSRPDLVAAAREAGDARFDVLVSCAFSYDAPPRTSTSSAASPSSRRG